MLHLQVSVVVVTPRYHIYILYLKKKLKKKQAIPGGFISNAIIITTICWALIILQSCCRVAAKSMFSVNVAIYYPWAEGVKNFFISHSKAVISLFFIWGGICFEIVVYLIASP